MNIDDEIIISGIASCPNGKIYQNAVGIIATISKDGYIKVWMNESDEDPWFCIDNIVWRKNV